MERDSFNSKSKLYFFLLILIILSSTQKGYSQEYEYEIGGIAGTSFYMGDANKSALYHNSHLSGGFILRYNRNFRWAYKINFLAGGVSGDTRNSSNVFPNEQNASFSRMFYEFGGQVEFNFFHYSDKYGYLGTKRFSPYIFTGLGITYGSGKKTFMGVNLPMGIGLKYKLKERLNLGFELSFRKLFNDSFDVTTNSGDFDLENPYKIESSFLKNKDWYVLTMFSLTWDFGLRKKPCCINSIY